MSHHCEIITAYFNMNEQKQHTEYALQLKGIGHHFQQNIIFSDVDLNIAKAKVVAIVGVSGVGKTTLFNIVAGLIQPSQGRVLIHDRDCTGQTGHVGYMLQKDLLLAFKTVYDNIALPLILKGKPKKTIEEKILPLLDDFGLTGLMSQYPQMLSGGQRQRAALLRTYLSNQQLMLLDEPFSALDFMTKHQMYQWFRDFQKQQQLTCLMITHDIDEAIYLADDIYVLKGTPARFQAHFVVSKDDNFFDSIAYLQLKQNILQTL